MDVQINAPADFWQAPLQFSFTTGNFNSPGEIPVMPANEFSEVSYGKESGTEVTVINGVAVPSDFPVFNPTVTDSGAGEGKLFLTTRRSTPYIMILESDGTPYFYRRVEHWAVDFKAQPDNKLTRRYEDKRPGFIVMDSTYTNIDTLHGAHGYKADAHECLMTPDGHYFLIVQGMHQQDMSKVVAGGHPNATIIDCHIQEFDADHNLVFEWLSFDHFNVEDAIHENLKSSVIDYMHTNSIAIDYDGHLIISSRNLSEVTKINRNTGDIIWRLGGQNNQFLFVNDEYELSYQHFVKPVSGHPNRYLIFDNGTHREPEFSRAVEFQLDTVNMTATKVWEYRHNPDRFSIFMGNAQRLDNGNTLIGWASGSLPKATEVTTDGQVVYEGDFHRIDISYRTLKYEWEGRLKRPYLLAESQPDKIALIFNRFGDENVRSYTVYGGQNKEALEPIATTEDTWLCLRALENHRTYYFSVCSNDINDQRSPFSDTVEVFVNYVASGDNLLLNGSFDDAEAYWNFSVKDQAEAEGSVNEDSLFHCQITKGSYKESAIQLSQEGVPLIQGRKYLLEFDAYADEARTIDTKLVRVTYPWSNYAPIGLTVLQQRKEHFSYAFKMEEPTDFNARLNFNLGYSGHDVYIDNISLKDISSTDIEDVNNFPIRFRLYQNYPNPFNPKTVIRYSLPVKSDVQLVIYNLLGQKISTLISEKQQAGSYRVTWKAANYPSGVYFYRLKTSGGFIETKKMLLIR